jgi:hypothetical protein
LIPSNTPSATSRPPPSRLSRLVPTSSGEPRTLVKAPRMNSRMSPMGSEMDPVPDLLPRATQAYVHVPDVIMTDGQILDSIKHATGYEQTATEQAKDAGSDLKRGAQNFGQGARDEFNNVTGGLRDGPSTGSAPSSGGSVSPTSQRWIGA